MIIERYLAKLCNTDFYVTSIKNVAKSIVNVGFIKHCSFAPSPSQMMGVLKKLGNEYGVEF